MLWRHASRGSWPTTRPAEREADDESQAAERIKWKGIPAEWARLREARSHGQWHIRKPLNTGQMLTDSLTWRELELVHNFACHNRRIRRSARRCPRKSAIVSQLGNVLATVPRAHRADLDA
jgi:hypothetical protein